MIERCRTDPRLASKQSGGKPEAIHTPPVHYFLLRHPEHAALLRFAHEIDDPTFARLTRQHLLPQHWYAIHFDEAKKRSRIWDLFQSREIVTVAKWFTYLTGQPYHGQDGTSPQDPVPELVQYIEDREAAKVLRLVPCTISEANEYVSHFHRHCGEVQGALFALAVADRRGVVRGVAIVGRPIARRYGTGQNKGRIVEVRRVATDGARNCCSMLYAAARRIAKIQGYERIITYTLQHIETGASLRADGWLCVAQTGGTQWNGKRTRRVQEIYNEPKYRWEYDLGQPLPFEQIVFPAHPTSFTRFLETGQEERR
ncbi:MAG TPA: XF1762 family protein [Ktedonobacteraceae bacterium]|nr:XF1762 family protein [Ktedonobacteraceae bacterium]